MPGEVLLGSRQQFLPQMRRRSSILFGVCGSHKMPALRQRVRYRFQRPLRPVFRHDRGLSEVHLTQRVLDMFKRVRTRRRKMLDGQHQRCFTVAGHRGRGDRVRGFGYFWGYAGLVAQRLMHRRATRETLLTDGEGEDDMNVERVPVEYEN